MKSYEVAAKDGLVATAEGGRAYRVARADGRALGPMLPCKTFAKGLHMQVADIALADLVDGGINYVLNTDGADGAVVAGDVINKVLETDLSS